MRPVQSYAAAALLIAMTPSPAFAAVPADVQAMIDAAIADGNDAEIAAIVKYAKKLYPAYAAQIAQQFDEHKAAKKQAREERLANAGFFENWKGEGQLGGFRSTGNTSNAGISAGLKLGREGLKWRHKFSTAFDYQRTNGITSKDQLRAVIETNYKFDNRLFAFGLAQYERDRFQGFSSRYSVSGGLGFRAISGGGAILDVKAGPAYRLTEFTGGGSESDIGGLAALDFDWQIAPNFKLLEDASALAESGNISLVSTTAINARIIGSLSAQLSYSVEHETDPPAGRLSTDTITRATLVYGF